MKGFAPLLILIIPVFVYTFISCNDTVCSDFTTEQVIVKFYDIGTRLPKTLKVNYIAMEGSDSLIYNPDSLFTYSLPVNPAADSLVYYFVGDTVTNILTVRYKQQQRFISEECGFLITIANIQAGFSTFPHVIGLGNELSTLNDTNIEIYH